MWNQITEIAAFILRQYLHLWPYLLITIPLAVAVRLSGAARYIKKVLGARPLAAILGATLVGAFSPFCSCGVIPLISALLVGGVPIAPVMSFWLASPSMDPEIFLLTVSKLGWELAVWRLVATFLLSLGAGFITHLAVTSGWLGGNLLREGSSAAPKPFRQTLRKGLTALRARLAVRPAPQTAPSCLTSSTAAGVCTARLRETTRNPVGAYAVQTTAAAHPREAAGVNAPATSVPAAACGCRAGKPPFIRRLATEAAGATLRLLKFMSLAFFLEALIVFYLPSTAITALLGTHSVLAIPLAALVGVPVYTTNLTAVGMVAGLLHQGMSPAAALSFLIAGATTTLPAMSAVFGLTRKRLFFLYVGFTLFGALLSGILFRLSNVLF